MMANLAFNELMRYLNLAVKDHNNDDDTIQKAFWLILGNDKFIIDINFSHSLTRTLYFHLYMHRVFNVAAIPLFQNKFSKLSENADKTYEK